MTGWASEGHRCRAHGAVIGGPRFTGRNEGLAALRSALVGDVPAVALIEGDAGIGKSPLLAELPAEPPGGTPAAAPGRTLVAVCPPFRRASWRWPGW
jgi:hypothetical protein